MLSTILQSPRNRIIAIVVTVVLLLGGVAVALMAGGDQEEAAPTTTTVPTTTTTAAPTTTVTIPVAPLTGITGDHGGLIHRPPLALKFDNVEPKARPQAGLNEADVVYEERVEGSVTRLLAIFHSTDAAPVGPVRSARTSDIQVYTALGKPYFAWSGANPTFAERIRATNVVDVGYDAVPGQYFRDRSRGAPSNLMAHGTAELLSIPSEGTGPPPALFTYRTPEQVPAHLEPVAGVRITYGTSAGSAPVEYHWNGQGWGRTQKGTPHVDAAGVQVAPANVIVQFTNYGPSDVGDQFGVAIPEAQMVGEGEAWVLTNGGLVVARWQKPTVDAVTSYTDVDGTPIGLTPGRTWVALAQPGGGERL
ncbi:MAG: DUF3048 domain-containing protein [Acidimicrobiales bacterium]